MFGFHIGSGAPVGVYTCRLADPLANSTWPVGSSRKRPTYGGPLLVGGLAVAANVFVVGLNS